MNKLTFTLLLVGLFAAACLARTSPQIRRPFKFVPGQTYIYEYRGRQWNGLTKLADQYAGLTLDCDVILQSLPESQGKEVLMKLDDIKVEQLHTQALNNNDIRKLNQGQEVNTRQMTLYKEELSKPIRFTYVDGKVLRFVAETNDVEWSINIKKSILSLFQLDLAPTKIIKSTGKQIAEQIYNFDSELSILNANEMPLVYPIYEESFGGICETLYEIDSSDNVEQRQQQDFVEFNDVLNVTKTVNYKNCLTDPSVSFDRHSFNVKTQTIKGKLYSNYYNNMYSNVATDNYNTIPDELKSKYSNVYTQQDGKNNVASPVPVERHSYTKYNITTAPQSLVERRTVPVSSPADMSLIEGIYSEGKIKYEADGDILVSDTQQSLKLITVAPTADLARVAPEISQLVQGDVLRQQQTVQYETIQCELNTQKLKFYQALWKVAQLQQSLKQTNMIPGSSQQGTAALYSHQMALPFALSASWYPIVATGSQSPESSLERLVDPEQLAKEYEQLLISLAEDVLVEDVAVSKKAGEKVVRLVNIVAFLPKYKLVDIYERIVEHIKQEKVKQMQIIQTQSAQQQQQLKLQAILDNEIIAKWKIVRKLFLDSLPLAGSKQAIEMVEMLIQFERVKTTEAKELCEAVPANFRYPDTEIIDAFVRISQLQQVRKSRPLFASCSIACGKMIGQAYAKSKDASYKPTTYEPASKLPSHLREDELVKQVVQEADPRRQMPLNWNSPIESQLYERLVLDEQDLIKYVNYFKQLLTTSSSFHEKVVYIETLVHMKVPHVLPVLEPFVSGRLSLAQCLGNKPLDIERPIEQSQWYNYYGNQRTINQRTINQQQSSKDWSETNAFGAEECNYIRTIAVYGLAHLSRVAPNKVQAILLPVFDNTYEPYQIRIAAFTTMMLTPIEEHILERIASQMWREPSKEVASFVVGTIDTMSKLTVPSMAPYRYAAQKAAESMPKQYLDTWKFSWLAGGDHFNKQKNTGMSWIAELIKSNVSSIPRAAYIHLGRHHGPAGSKFDNHLELGFTSKGLETLLKEYVAYNNQQVDDSQINIIASIFENLYDAKDDIVKYYREARDSVKSNILSEEQKVNGEKYSQNFFFKRQQPIDGVNGQQGKQGRKMSDLFEGLSGAASGQATVSRSKRSITLQARTSADDDEEPKLTLFTKLFDSTSYHALDKRQMIDLMEKFDDYIKMAADELVLGGKLHYVKMMMPSNMWHMVPSQLGLPIVVTHRTPIVASIKVDAGHNGQLTSNKLSQFYRQEATGNNQQIPNIQGHNFITMQGLNITAMVHPKIMHSNYRFLFAVEQANCEAYGVQVEKSHQFSLPMEVSVAYSRPKQLVSLSIQPKTPLRMIWTKEGAKTFIGPLRIASSQISTSSSIANGAVTPISNWLGQEHLIRIPSKQSQYKRLNRPEHFVPSLLASVQSLLNEPKESQLALIEELETPYKFEHRFIQQLFGLELYLEGVSDDEDIVRTMNKPELTKQSRTPLQWTSTDEIDELDQHSKCGPMGEYLHIIESAINRPSKYLEFYTTLKPEQPHKSPVYRFDFVLSEKKSPISNGQQQVLLGRRLPSSRLDTTQITINNNKSPRVWETIELNKQLNKFQKVQQQQQPIMLEVY